MPAIIRRTLALKLALLGGFLVVSVGALALSPRPPEREEENALKTYAAPDRTYTVEVPKLWRLKWSPGSASGEASELQLVAPNGSWPNQVFISIRHYAGAHRTWERYLRERLHPRFGRLTDVPGTVTDVITMSGLHAKSLDVDTKRHPLPGMTGEVVPALQREIVVPAASGFFVLGYDVPQRLAVHYRPHFEVLTASFAPTDRSAAAADPIAADEYAVYAAFLRSRPAARPNGPQFFEDVPRARLLVGHTLALGKDAGKPDWPARDLRGVEPDLAADYRAKNAQEWVLTDRIDVPDLAVISRKALDAKLDAAGLRGLGVPRQPSLDLHGGYATLSRVGFNRAGDTALFKVALTNPGTMHTSYLVLMRKQNGIWTFADVAGQDFMIR